MFHIAANRPRLLLHASDIRHHLPDLFLRHSHALLRRAVRWHRGSRDSVVNRVENFGIRIAMLFRSARQIRPAPAAAPTQTMAKSAIRAKFKLAKLCHLDVTGIRVLPLSDSR